MTGRTCHVGTEEDGAPNLLGGAVGLTGELLSVDALPDFIITDQTETQ